MTAEAALPVPRRHRFTVEEYEGMAEHGLLPPDERLELIAGEVIQMSPIGWRHARCVNNLNALLVQALSGQAVISVQNPVILSARDEPQPDLAVLRLSANQHTGNAVPADVILLIEVADSTLAYDQRIKLPLYARSG